MNHPFEQDEVSIPPSFNEYTYESYYEEEEEEKTDSSIQTFDEPNDPAD